MTFSEALQHLKAGRQVRRKGRVIWLYLDRHRRIRELDADFGVPDLTLYEPTQEDLLAEDWEVRETLKTSEVSLV